MRVIYSGGTMCSFETLQRLILLADEIAFMDRPSVTFGNFGTVGADSAFRRFDTADAPIQFSVWAPPSGPASELYRRYVESDLQDAAFIRTVLDGIKSDPLFRSRVIQPSANYGWGTGQQIVEALAQDVSLYEGTYDLAHDRKLMYVPDTEEGRRHTFGALLLEASIHTTNALVVAEKAQAIPVSDDSYFCQLLALRTSATHYVSQPVALAPLLGLTVAKSVLPDESLAKLKIQDLFEFRRAAKEQYAAWSTELERVSLKLLDVPAERLSKEATKLVLTDIQPRVDQLRRDLESARDKLFGDLVKSVTRWEVPTISLSYIAGLSLPGALAAFASALTPAVPGLVDYFVQRRALYRNNSMAYLVGLSNLEKGES
jgi:hypothetical protein